ncbi:protein piwi-like [Folsomia candida]|uniref:protein piwi-like n=1 Tax=Folsomia candida TaxID=158441 RepID=UPI001604A3DC|nr:protein piwi-like [Folsomia candida]
MGTTSTLSKSKLSSGAVGTSSSGRGRGKMATEEVENKAPLGQQPAAAAGTEEAQTLASQRDRAPMIRRGAKGEEIAAATNYIRLRFIGNCTIHESHVDFDPPLDSTMMKNRSVRAVMGDRTYTFDGRMLFTTVKFDEQLSCLTDFMVTELKGFHPNSPDTELNIIHYRLLEG